MHPFPLMEAFRASLDPERPSGDDPKRVALALSRFYTDLQKHFAQAAKYRWRTDLFGRLQPAIRSDVAQLIALLDSAVPTLPQTDTEILKQIHQLDESVRKATFELEQEEQACGLPVFESPKLNRFNYLYEGWRRNLLPSTPLKEYLSEYLPSVKQTQAEVEVARSNVNPRESEEEKQAVEDAANTLDTLSDLLSQFQSRIDFGAEKCAPLAEGVLQTGQKLGEVFHRLETCAPLEEPCPFCGGSLSLSGRCRSCGRRLPHLEESTVAQEAELTSEFRSNNCRALDFAVQRWESSPESEELWRALQTAVREFSNHVVSGRKSLEMLATAQDRPIDSAHPMRKNEEVLKEVAASFQQTVSLFSKFTQPAEPPLHPLAEPWRETLLEAERKLQELETAAQPEASE